jgi:hypothetical protein
LIAIAGEPDGGALEIGERFDRAVISDDDALGSLLVGFVDNLYWQPGIDGLHYLRRVEHGNIGVAVLQEGDVMGPWSRMKGN